MATTATINVKGERKVVGCTFTEYLCFKIPDGIDLEDKTIVASWGVKWGTLRIVYTNGQEEEILFEDNEPDYKHPATMEIQPAEDWGVEYSEDEEDEPNQLELTWLGMPEPDYDFIVRWQERNEDGSNCDEETMTCIDDWEEAVKFYMKTKNRLITYNVKIYKAGYKYWDDSIKGRLETKTL